MIRAINGARTRDPQLGKLCIDFSDIPLYIKEKALPNRLRLLQ